MRVVPAPERALLPRAALPDTQCINDQASLHASDSLLRAGPHASKLRSPREMLPAPSVGCHPEVHRRCPGLSHRCPGRQTLRLRCHSGLAGVARSFRHQSPQTQRLRCWSRQSLAAGWQAAMASVVLRAQRSLSRGSSLQEAETVNKPSTRQTWLGLANADHQGRRSK